MSACGCSSAADDDASVTTEPSGSGGSVDDVDESLDDGGSSDDSATISTSEDESDGDDIPELKFDLPPQPDLPPVGDCTVTMADSSILEQHPDCSIERGGVGPCWTEVYLGCVDPEPGQTCASLCPDGNCIADGTYCMGDYLWAPRSVCGPYEIDGQCCSIAASEVCE